MSQSLTIIVPAWKAEFLADALDSIVAQDDKSSDVLIIDDCAPPNVGHIAKKYPQFKYHRFEENLGGSNLSAHWSRCLDLVNTDWVWLFSDDDVMTSNCVSSFWEATRRNGKSRVFQFALLEVDSTLLHSLGGNVPVPLETASDFLNGRLRNIRTSAMPEHVFHVETFKSILGAFPDFPLAWNVDDATWIALAQFGGIGGIPEATVLWRQSNFNISSRTSLSNEKCSADISFLRWVSLVGVQLPSQFVLARWSAHRWQRVYRIGWCDGAREARKLPALHGVMAFGWFALYMIHNFLHRLMGRV